MLIMRKKIERKNITNLDIVWTKDPCFTIQELNAVNPNFKEITLRVRVNKKREAGEIVEIAHVSGEQGRPRKIFTLAPVSLEAINFAKNKNYSLVKIESPMTTGVIPVTNIVRTVPAMTV